MENFSRNISPSFDLHLQNFSKKFQPLILRICKVDSQYFIRKSWPYSARKGRPLKIYTGLSLYPPPISCGIEGKSMIEFLGMSILCTVITFMLGKSFDFSTAQAAYSGLLLFLLIWTGHLYSLSAARSMYAIILEDMQERAGHDKAKAILEAMAMNAEVHELDGEKFIKERDSKK